MSGFIYAIESGDWIKIGFSRKPEQRLNKIASDSPIPCVLLGYWGGTLSDEGAIHKEFRHLHARGEWFVGAPELRAFVAEHAQERVFRNKRDDQRFTIKNGDGVLAVWRKNRRLTQAQVGQLVGLDASEISRLEGGHVKPSYDTIWRVARASQGYVSPNDWFGIPRVREAAE